MSEEARLITLEQYKDWQKTKEENKVLREKLIQHCPELEEWLNLRFPQNERD